MRPSGDPKLIKALSGEMKARRDELKISQEEVAHRCEINRPFITLLESGKKQPTISTLFKVSMALELSFGEFASRIEARYRATP